MAAWAVAAPARRRLWLRAALSAARRPAVVGRELRPWLRLAQAAAGARHVAVRGSRVPLRTPPHAAGLRAARRRADRVVPAAPLFRPRDDRGAVLSPLSPRAPGGGPRGRDRGEARPGDRAGSDRPGDRDPCPGGRLPGRLRRSRGRRRPARALDATAARVLAGVAGARRGRRRSRGRAGCARRLLGNAPRQLPDRRLPPPQLLPLRVRHSDGGRPACGSGCSAVRRSGPRAGCAILRRELCWA